MRWLQLLVPVLLLGGVPAAAQANKVRIQVLESSSDEQDYNIPGRLVCSQLYGCMARGAETAAVYTIKVKARMVKASAQSPPGAQADVEPQGVAITLTCQLRKKGDQKHCTRLVAGVYSAEPKGKDKLTVYAWANPVYAGDFSKANKLEFSIGAGEP
jgi:hypothetical protein